ncbi:MAG: hypothetical protein ACRDQ5_26930 [Sciscionella sp.]
MDEVFFHAVADAVGRYLDATERLDANAATGEHLRRLALAWRALLRLHRPGARGGCAGCARGRREMCSVWRVAVAYFIRP